MCICVMYIYMCVVILFNFIKVIVIYSMYMIYVIEYKKYLVLIQSKLCNYLPKAYSVQGNNITKVKWKQNISYIRW